MGKTSKVFFMPDYENCFRVRGGMLLEHIGCGGNISIPDSITEVEGWAFINCTEPTIVKIPASVTKIAPGAFASDVLMHLYVAHNNPFYRVKQGILFNKEMTQLLCCPGLKTGNYAIPLNVELIEDYAFAECAQLTAITIPDSVFFIGNAAFHRCYRLSSITLPKGISIISDWMFFECIRLKSVTIPSTVIEIGDWAFSECEKLASICIPDSVKVIGDGTFSGCTNITSIFIPSSVKAIGKEPFQDCPNLVIFTSAGSYAQSYAKQHDIPCKIAQEINGCTICEDVLIKYAGSSTHLVIPEGVKHIRDGAFYECALLNSITMPVSVERIDGRAFDYQPRLTITTPSGSYAEFYARTHGIKVRTTGKKGTPQTNRDKKLRTQKNDTEGRPVGKELLSQVPCSNGFEIRGETLIRYIGNGKKVVVPNDVTVIESGAFYSCKQLTYIVIPRSVTRIGNNAFDCIRHLIIAPTGSYAEIYAKVHGIQFKSL